VGCELWQLLSKAFGKQVNKSNFSQFIRRQAISVSYFQGKNKSLVTTATLKKKYQDWGTAPDISEFYGRVPEIQQIVNWIDDRDCRLILISGMVGIGKTTLATQVAQKLSQQFDYIIWRSLRNAPPPREIIDSLLTLFSHRRDVDLSTSLDRKLIQLVSYLRQYRCLIVLDDLQSVLDQGERACYYLSGYEGYGQLLRSIICTQHQSLFMTTSRVIPKGLTFYGQEKVGFLSLQGLDGSDFKNIYGHRFQILNSDKQWQDLLKYYLYNPQFISIVTGKIEQLFDDNINDFLNAQLTLLEEVSLLIAQEFKNLTPLEKEIAYWLAIECSPMSGEKLAKKIIQPVVKSKIIEGINLLKQRSLVKQENFSYTLHPLFKEYLRRKLIEQACQNC
jgi:hypothetical protein